MEETCGGSLGEPGERPEVPTFLPVALCRVCTHYVEIQPMQSGGAEVWRLEMHDTSGRTIRIDEAPRPAADCIIPGACPKCESLSLSLAPSGDDLEATCSSCEHRWQTGRVTPT
jgi:hypothetical protein